MSVIIRPFVETDYPAIVRVFNACQPDSPWSEADARHRDGTWDYKAYVRLRHVAELDGDGRVVGYGQISHHMFAFHPRKFSLHVMVEPAARRRGAGTALYEMLLEELRARDALLCRFDLSETDAETIAFASRRGFAEVARFWESRLDVAALDPARFPTAEPKAPNIVIVPISTLAVSDANWERRLYHLFATCSADEPQLDEHTIPSFETWRIRNVGHPHFLTEASTLALDPVQQDAPIGLSLLYRHGALPDVLQQSFTGVLASHRGRGIARAMKLAGIAWARANGYRQIRTENHSLNDPMLRINETLGFVRQPSHITFEKRLE